MVSKNNKLNLLQWIFIIGITFIILYLLWITYKDKTTTNNIFKLNSIDNKGIKDNKNHINDEMFTHLIDNFQNNKIIDSDENYQLTENTSHHLDNVYNEYIKSNNRSHVFFDISRKIDKLGELGELGELEYLGRIIIELFDDIVPNTVENFLHMTQYKYKGSIFHRIIKDFVIQGGDFINGNGTGSQSIYGSKFPDENFDLKHDEKYLLSMANSGPNTNGCQFFITLNVLPNLDNKHVVFGKLYDQQSRELIDRIGEIKTDKNNKPLIDYIISDCGILDNN